MYFQKNIYIIIVKIDLFQILHPSLLVTLNGKLQLDQMNDEFARAIFSEEVESLLQEKNPAESEFVKLVRNALITAADTPAIPALTRARYLLQFDR